MTSVALTPEQIRRNIVEDAREYQDLRIEELTAEEGTAYSHVFMHAAMISHWATLFREPVSTMLTNFRSTPSIAIPAARNLDPPPIFPTASGSGATTAAEELEAALAYPSDDDDDWEVQLVDTTPALPILPPHAIHPEVLAHLHTIHLTTATPPPLDIFGPNREPMTPTDPVPSMPSLPPQFLQTDPLDPAPVFEQIVNALVQRDIDAQVTRIEREEEEEQRTPSPTGAQPGVHPGPGWGINFTDAAINYVYHIPDGNGGYEIAPFISIDWNTTSPELLGTRGRGCPTHAKHLHTCEDEFPRTALDHRQEFFFAEHQTHTEGVDWAMQQEGDDTLQAEVIRHRAARTKVIRRARQVAELHEQLADDRYAFNQSTRRLTRTNSYRRLRWHITNTLTPATSSLSSRHIHHIQEAVDSLWNTTSDKLSSECMWCRREGHTVEHCALLRVCDLCHARGHLEENCFQPHSRCVSFQVCRVPLLHTHRRRHACPSTVTIEWS